MLLSGVFLGGTAVLLAPMFLNWKIARKTGGVSRYYTGNLHREALVDFLNSHLQTISPDLTGWEHHGQDSRYCEWIATDFQGRKLVLKYINNDSTKGNYAFSVRKRLSSVAVVAVTPGGFSVQDAGAGFMNLNYPCMYRTAPIISAAMEYYFKMKGMEKK